MITHILTAAVTPANLIALLLGSAVGLFLGVLPGLGGVFGLTIAIPLTAQLPTLEALGFLVAMYTAAVYGGAITAILFRIPGHPGNIATTFEGPALSRDGRAAEAIVSVGFAGVIGGLISLIIVLAAGPLIAEAGVHISPADYFMLTILALALVSSISGGRPVEGMTLAGIGFMMSTVGLNSISGTYRFTFGSSFLQGNGINLAVVAVGLFGLGSAFYMADTWQRPTEHRATLSIRRGLIPGLRAIKNHPIETIRSGIIGALVGVLPGVGISLSNILAYTVESRLKRNAGWGKGNIVGVMAPEAADNATLVTELVPAFALGIPGAAPSALMLYAIIQHGLQPGIQFFSNGVDGRAFFILMGLSLAVFTVLGMFLSGLFASAAATPLPILLPAIAVVCCIGSYAVSGSIGNVVVALLTGLLGYSLLKLDLPLAPVLLGVILGPLSESNYRRALLIQDATHHSPFLGPIPLTLGVVAIITFILPIMFKLRKAGGKVASSQSRATTRAN